RCRHGADRARRADANRRESVGALPGDPTPVVCAAGSAQLEGSAAELISCRHFGCRAAPMRRRHEPASTARLISRGPSRRTVFIRATADDRAPQELWDVICDGSDVVLVVDAPDEGFSLYGDCVVAWNDPHVVIDGMIYLWPEQSTDVRRLFES